MKVLFRADASALMGTGHVMRCIALAQAVSEDDGEVFFASAELLPALEARLKQEKFSRTRIKAKPNGPDDAQETATLAKSLNADWVVIDGYGFDAGFQETLKKSGLHVLALDDFGHAKTYSADIVLNQNVSAKEEWYAKRNSGVKLLLGARYAMLRKEFRLRKNRMKREGNVRHVVITFGGADTQNITGKALAAISSIDFSGIVSVIIGKSNPNADALRFQAATSKGDIRIVDGPDMPAILSTADMAVTAAGTTSWELLYMGVPFITGAFAENQVAVADALGIQGLAENAGWYPDLTEEDLAGKIQELLEDADRRTEYSRKGLETVDGEGVIRVLSNMRRETVLTLRDVTIEDATLLHSWANDPVIRSSSFSPDPIPWEEHHAWMHRKIADLQCHIYIGSEENQLPVGQIRFDIRDDGDAEVDIHTAPDARGKGYGTRLIQEGVKRFFGTTKVRVVHAFAKTENEASGNAFIKAGFENTGKEKMWGEEVYHLVFRRS